MYEIINNILLQVKEYNGQRVVTFRDIDTVHHRPEGTAKRNFNRNQKHFIEGQDFFKVKCSEVGTNFVQTPNGFNPDADIMLFTEMGYLMLVKSFRDDLAWDIQRQIVNSYFKVQQIQANGVPALTQYIKGMEQRQNELESRVELLEKRITELENQRTTLLAPAPKEKTFYFTNDDNEYHIKDFLNSDKVEICPYAEVQALLLYKLYQEWCRENNIYCCSIAMFGTRIKKIDGISHRKTKRCKKYIGIKVPIIY